MDDSLNLRTWQNGPVGYVQINRPDKSNAYNESLLKALESIVIQQEADSKISAIVICGAGNRSFCSGADLDEMQKKDFRSALNLRSAQVFDKISACPKVTVAAINGAAVGGGLELALACDMRIAVKGARFFFPETKLGLIPAAGGTRRLPKIIGKALAKEMILAGRILDSSDAERWGLVSEIVDFDDLLPRAQQLGDQIAQRDPVAIQLAKKAIDADSMPGIDGNFELVAEALLYQVKREKKGGIN
jgi:enoyl-CoA hydratase